MDQTTTEEGLVHAKHVLALEIAGLEALQASLGQDFAEAIRLILACRARLIVTGMGKSGHIGKKISATLSSTGTPSLFVHPAEASHGDLGMITPDDVILALSNSGESRELESVLLHAKRCNIKIISMTSRPASTLGRASDVVLKMPAAKEACPLELAPTTSTTMALALGDTLAMVLMKARGFTTQDFGFVHPGGKLGAQLRTAAEVCGDRGLSIPLVAPDTPMRETLLVMTNYRLGCAGICDKAGDLIGIITDGDLRRALDDQSLLDKQVQEVMVLDPVCVSPQLLAVEVLNLMEQRKITAVFVVENKKPKGLIHLHDLLQGKAV